MRVRIIFLFSLVLNAALGVALITWLASAPENKPRVVRPINFAAVNGRQAPIVKTNVLVRPRSFAWQEVESPDYVVYVENLRLLGMPATTVRDIIVADVEQLFAKRQREEAAKQDIEWWRSTPSYEAESNALARTHDIDAERIELLTKLLGPDWNKGRAQNESSPLALAGPVLGNLPEDVKTNVLDIASRSQARVASYLSQLQASGQEPNASDLAKMREETRQQLAAILSPQQLEEFLLRYSENANRLRRDLTGFNPTPDEFRAMFRATDSIDRDLQSRAADDDPASQRARQSLEQQRLLAIRNALGPERFAAYQTINDPAYRDALAVAQQVGGGDEAARALYDISKATTDEINRIRNDTRLTDAQKQQQLREAELEQQRARALVLGETPAAETGAPGSSATAAVEPRLYAHPTEIGETLPFLAVRFGVSMDALREANPGLNFSRLPPGTPVNIPPLGTGTPPPLGGTPLPILPPGLRR
ncbi:MAG TPA: LysM domain-containing protein [Candidatus Limnocylindria bacterium]|nr:LysM domain-containing protein [Candidatus Limnocylindria bacterium]